MLGTDTTGKKEAFKMRFEKACLLYYIVANVKVIEQG